MSSSSSSQESSSSQPGGRSLSLRRLAQSRYVINAQSGYRFRVEVAAAVGMPPEVFRYLERDNPANPAVSVAAFDGVCSPADLEDYPALVPDRSRGPRFFRLDYVDLVLRSQHTAEEAWEILQEELTTLVATLNLMDDLGVIETLQIG